MSKTRYLRLHEPDSAQYPMHYIGGEFRKRFIRNNAEVIVVYNDSEDTFENVICYRINEGESDIAFKERTLPIPRRFPKELCSMFKSTFRMNAYSSRPKRVRESEYHPHRGSKNEKD